MTHKNRSKGQAAADREASQNMIRKTFYPEYYQLKPAVGAERLHLGIFAPSLFSILCEPYD